MHLTLSAVRLLPRRLRDPLLRRLTRVNEAELADVEVRLATTVPELFESARLLHAMYVARGLIEPKPSGMRATPHLLLPSTATFIARRGDAIVGTLALVVDSPLGLPMEKAFPEEVKAVRAPDRRAAEVGALCVAPGARRQGVSYLLTKLMWRCAREVCGVDDLLIAVVPPADELYRAAMLFERIGPTRRHPSVKNGVVTVPMRLDLRAAPGAFKGVFGAKPTVDNPYHRYCVHTESHLHMPSPEDFMLAGEARRRTARTLAPACATGLDALEVAQLRHFVEATGTIPAASAHRLAAAGGE